MKVICIKGAKAGEVSVVGTPVDPSEVIIEGQEYSVIWAGNSPLTGDPCYKLSGKPRTTFYTQSRFIPLSSVDETEMIRNYETQPE